MPFYLYEHPDTLEIVEVYQRMNDEHKYIDDNGVEYRRVFTPHQVANTIKIDPFSKTAFLEKTNNGGSIGDLIDRSKELSEKRKDIVGEGVDPNRIKYFDEYSKKRNGKRHAEDKRPVIKKKISDLHESKKEKRKA